MNANRRADLQRKLAVAPVPKPPAGLAAKIKSDIPKELRFSAERERARFAQSARVSLAVAASVIVVIASAYLALQIGDKNLEVKPAAARRIDRPPVLQTETVAAPPPAPVAAPKAKEVRLARRQKKIQVEAKQVEAKSELADRAVRTEPMPAAKIAVTAAAPAASAAVAQNVVVEEQTTTSPISGRRYGFADARLTPWKDVPREVKIQILKDELAHGADPKDVARVARDSGLSEFADSLEKKQH